MTTRLFLIASIVLAGSAVVPATVSDAGATLVRGMPVSIETSGHGCVSREFTLRFLQARAQRASDTGSAVLSVDPGTVELSGTELLVSRRGTLTLRWSANDPEQNGTWGEVTGTWSIADGTGAYSGLHGRGRFASASAFATIVYRGLLVTAV